jgi:uncharacterized protein YndB with AHSA1/START domain
MPRLTRSRTIRAPRERIWEMVSDPHHLARWWPLAHRVEDVRADDEPMRWTLALLSQSGTQVRADFSGGVEVEGSRFTWNQDVAGTPFERILKGATVAIDVAEEPGHTDRSKVTVTLDERLRGLSRLGSPIMRAAARRRVDEALENLDRAVGGAA